MARDRLDGLTFSFVCPLAADARLQGGGLCSVCNEVVHDLSALSRTEALGRLADPAVRCVRVVRGPGGRVRTGVPAAIAGVLAACATHGGQELSKPKEVSRSEIGPGVLVVEVVDPLGLPVPHARVEVDALQPVFTDEKGLVTVRGLGDKVAQVRATSEDWSEAMVQDVRVTWGNRIQLTLTDEGWLEWVGAVRSVYWRPGVEEERAAAEEDAGAAAKLPEEADDPSDEGDAELEEAEDEGAAPVEEEGSEAEPAAPEDPTPVDER